MFAAAPPLAAPGTATITPALPPASTFQSALRDFYAALQASFPESTLALERLAPLDLGAGPILVVFNKPILACFEISLARTEVTNILFTRRPLYDSSPNNSSSDSDSDSPSVWRRVKADESLATPEAKDAAAIQMLLQRHAARVALAERRRAGRVGEAPENANPTTPKFTTKAKAKGKQSKAKRVQFAETHIVHEHPHPEPEPAFAHAAFRAAKYTKFAAATATTAPQSAQTKAKKHQVPALQKDAYDALVREEKKAWTCRGPQPSPSGELLAGDAC